MGFSAKVLISCHPDRSLLPRWNLSFPASPHRARPGVALRAVAPSCWRFRTLGSPTDAAKIKVRFSEFSELFPHWLRLSSSSFHRHFPTEAATFSGASRQLRKRSCPGAARGAAPPKLPLCGSDPQTELGSCFLLRSLGSATFCQWDGWENKIPLDCQPAVLTIWLEIFFPMLFSFT